MLTNDTAVAECKVLCIMSRDLIFFFKLALWTNGMLAVLYSDWQFLFGETGTLLS